MPGVSRALPRPRALLPAALALGVLLSCAKGDATGPGAGPRVTVYDAPPGPAWNGTASVVTVGDRASCLLNTDNTVWCWGNNRGINLRVDAGLRNVPQWQNAETVIDSICFAKRTGPPGSILGWPCNIFKPVRLSPRAFAKLTLPMRDEPLCAIDAAGAPFCWDQGPSVVTTPDSTSAGGLEWCGTTFCLSLPQPMRTAQRLASFAPNTTLCALSSTGTVLCRGRNSKALMGNRGINFVTDTFVPVLGAPAATAIAASPDGYFACAVATTQKVWCWGESLYGAVGNGSFSETVPSPVQVTSTQNFRSLVATLGAVCGLTTAGAAWCWGDGRSGQIGWNGYGWSTTPYAVSGGRVFTQLAAGPGHICGLDTGGAAWCWGDNSYGQLGALRPSTPCTGGPAIPCSPVPVAVIGGHQFRQLAAGIAHTCGVTTTNEVWCWGWTAYGRIGQAMTLGEFVETPTRVMP